MRTWRLGEVTSVLALGAHSDDIEIGAGGAIRCLLERAPSAKIRWIVFAGRGERGEEARKSFDTICGTRQGCSMEALGFRDGFFPYEGGPVKEAFERLKAEIQPDLIFTHYGNDRHQDHRLIAELTWNTFRDHAILEYEIPKYDGGLGSPNFFVPLSSDVVDVKVRQLLEAFGTQRSRAWFTEDTFRGLMRLRGVECNSPSGYAEAFYVRKAVWQGD